LSNCSNIDNLTLSSFLHHSSAQRTSVISVVISMVKYISFLTDSLRTSVPLLSLFLTIDISCYNWCLMLYRCLLHGYLNLNMCWGCFIYELLFYCTTCFCFLKNTFYIPHGIYSSRYNPVSLSFTNWSSPSFFLKSLPKLKPEPSLEL